ncbi:phosphohydrolase [Ciceribacter thiooxidans]|uniref:Phosphohydrolase n=1 Tax=Ciceribacter thiooxidans TaxID=1969821 RepID=A0ABV7I099_9HYPH|nr:phosphohydrolase [Ciceribacter thiooxidans]
MNDTRIGGWIQTYTGKRFYPLDARHDEVDIRDIAHALSMQCRYAGHCVRFYSVAEHCVLLSRHLQAEHGRLVARWALLHDASEAYILDIPRPLKPELANYREVEDRLMEVIANRFHLYIEMPSVLKDADYRILADEIAQNLVPLQWDNTPGPPLGIDLKFWTPEQAEEEFLAQFDAVRVERSLGTW